MQRLRFDELGGRTGRHHIAVTRLRPAQQTREHTHDFVELFLVQDGAGVHQWNGCVLTLGPGSLVLVHPADVHSFRSGANARLSFINLAVAADWWQGFLRLLSPPAPFGSLVRGDPPGHGQLDAPATHSCLSALSDLLARGAAEPALLASVVGHLVGHLLRPAPLRTLAPGAPPWLTRVMRDLGDPELLSQPIAFWQGRAGVSPEHFARACRRFFGEPPTALLNRARVELVQRRLRQGEEKIAGLALDAGFRNLGFFYRTFRRFAGCTPKQWLTRQATNATVPQ